MRLLHANNLMAADSNGKSDPYVKLSSAGVEKKSKTIKKTLDPVWNEVFELKGTLSDFLQQGLCLKFMDYDFMDKDDPLGELTVPLEALREQDTIEFADWPLPTQGTATFDVLWRPNEVPAKKGVFDLLGGSRTSKRMSTMDMRNSARDSTRDSARGAPPLLKTLGESSSYVDEMNALNGTPGAIDQFSRIQHRGRLRFILLRGKGLMAADSNGLSDPYVKATTYTGQKEETKKSSVKKKTLNPDWGMGEVLEFEGMLQTFLSFGLSIRVFDEDFFLTQVRAPRPGSLYRLVP